MPFNAEKLAKLVGNKTSAARTGGKGTVRRKRKAVRKAATTDDKRLKSTLNRLNVRDIPAIEEVNLFKEDGNVIHFNNPKVQASIAANTYVVSGHAETKKLQDLLPGIINQLGPDNLEHLKKVYASFAGKAAAGGAAGAAGADEEDVPDLVDNFEDVSKKAPAPAGAPAAAAAPAAKPAAAAPAAAAPAAAKADDKKPAEKKDKSANPMSKIRIEKLVVNCCVGEPGDRLTRASRVLQELTEQEPVFSTARLTVRSFSIRRNDKIACHVSVSGEKAEDILQRALHVKEFELKEKNFSKTGNFGFGIQEHIDLGLKYDPAVGIYGMDFYVVLSRAGRRVGLRKHKRARVGIHHQVTREDAKKWFVTKFGGHIRSD